MKNSIQDGLRIIAAMAASLLGAMALPAKAAEVQFQAASPLQVIELFTSQACPFSDISDKNLASFANDEGVLALTYPVTYWNYTGWQDTMSQKTFDQRQSAYNQRLGSGWLSTPQMIINGRKAIKGDDPAMIEQALAEASISPAPVKIAREDKKIMVRFMDSSLDPKLVLYMPGPISVAITSGKNAGRTLSYVNVVKALHPMQEENGLYFTTLSEEEASLACAILLEDRTSGEIASAALCNTSSQ